MFTNNFGLGEHVKETNTNMALDTEETRPTWLEDHEDLLGNDVSVETRRFDITEMLSPLRPDGRKLLEQIRLAYRSSAGRDRISPFGEKMDAAEMPPPVPNSVNVCDEMDAEQALDAFEAEEEEKEEKREANRRGRVDSTEMSKEGDFLMKHLGKKSKRRTTMDMFHDQFGSGLTVPSSEDLLVSNEEFELEISNNLDAPVNSSVNETLQLHAWKKKGGKGKKPASESATTKVPQSFSHDMFADHFGSGSDMDSHDQLLTSNDDYDDELSTMLQEEPKISKSTQKSLNENSTVSQDKTMTSAPSSGSVVASSNSRLGSLKTQPLTSSAKSNVNKDPKPMSNLREPSSRLKAPSSNNSQTSSIPVSRSRLAPPSKIKIPSSGLKKPSVSSSLGSKIK